MTPEIKQILMDAYKNGRDSLGFSHEMSVQAALQMTDALGVTVSEADVLAVVAPKLAAEPVAVLVAGRYEGFLAVAMRAHSRGQRVLPIQVGAKNPTMKWKGTAIDTDSNEQWAEHSKQWIRELAEQYPDAAACVLAKPYEYCFIDEDASDELRRGYEAFAGEPFPPTFTTESQPNHRQSHWLQTDATRACRNIAQENGLIFSFRQHNLYVLSEGAPHPKGGFYRIVDNTAAVPMPDKLVEYMRRLRDEAKATAPKPKEWQPDSDNASTRPSLNDGLVYGEGERNNRLSQYLYHRWVLECCDEDELRHDAYIFNETKLSPSLDDDEVEQTIDGKLGLKQRGTDVLTNGDLIAYANPDEPVTAEPDDEPEFEYLSLQERINKLLSENKTNEDVLELARINELIAKSHKTIAQEVGDWRAQFRSVGEMEQGPILMIVERFLPEGTCFIGATPASGKTLVGLALAKAICTGTPLFNKPEFAVSRAHPVIYLIPETGDRAFRTRCEAFRIPDSDMFLARTISMGASLQLSSPGLLEAVRKLNPVIFLDTATRFSESRDEKSASENKQLVDDVTQLRAAGAVCVVLLHHATKASKKEEMTLENMLRGTSDLGAMCDTAYGLKKDDFLYRGGGGPLEIDVQNLKPRDIINPAPPFRLAATYKRPGEALPVSHINETGDFRFVDLSNPVPAELDESEKEKLPENRAKFEVCQRAKTLIDNAYKQGEVLSKHQLATMLGISARLKTEILTGAESRPWICRPGPNRSVLFYPLSARRKDGSIAEPEKVD